MERFWIEDISAAPSVTELKTLHDDSSDDKYWTEDVETEYNAAMTTLAINDIAGRDSDDRIGMIGDLQDLYDTHCGESESYWSPGVESQYNAAMTTLLAGALWDSVDESWEDAVSNLALAAGWQL